MHFYAITPHTQIQRDRLKLREPVLETNAVPVAQHELDAVLLPLVSFDGLGGRLGMGGGFYDRYFADTETRPWMIGIAYSVQESLEPLPTQPWDIPLDAALLTDAFPLGSLLTLAGGALRSLGSVLSNGFLIILTVIFILAEAASFHPKLVAVLNNPDRDLAHFGRITGTMNRYIAIKTSVSVLTGFLVTTFLWILNVDFPVLWGLVALLLNFIPTIGSIIACVPPVLLALVQLGPTEALLVVAGFFAVNTIVGNVLEPRYMGRGLGLSALVVFLSLIFWGWLLGPVGMLLSVPLTISAKIALEVSPGTLWLARLLAPAQELADQTLKRDENSPTQEQKT